MEKESMVIYKSIISAIDLLPDAEQKWEAIKGVTDFGFYDKKPESENPIINMIYIQAIPSLRGAKDRYDKAVEDGKRGGRPAEVSIEKIIQMKNGGMTNKQIAEKTGCSVKNIENRITIYKKNNPNNPNNPPITPKVNGDLTNHPNNPNNHPNNHPNNPNNPNNLSVSVYVSDSVSASDTDTESVSVCNVAPQLLGYNNSTASPNNATGVAQQQTTTLSNLIKYKIREMWQPGVKQSDVIKSIKSEFDIDLTFADVNEIWDKYKSSGEKEKLRELAEKEESELAKQSKVSAKDKKHYNEINRASEIIKELNLNSVNEVNVTEKEIIDWYNDAYEKAKTQPKYKYDFTINQMIKFISDEVLTVDNIQELKNAWCKKINLERGWTWS